MPDSPAAILRRAAEKMRGLANAASEGPWAIGQSGMSVWVESATGDLFVADTGDRGNEFAEADAAFIAAMHPGVARLLADMWDEVANVSAFEERLGGGYHPSSIEALAVAAAREFLGEA